MYDNNRSTSYTDQGILHIKPMLLENRYGENFVQTGTLDLNGGSPSEE